MLFEQLGKERRQSKILAYLFWLIELSSGTFSPGGREIGLLGPEDAGIGSTEKSFYSLNGVSGKAPGISSLGTLPANSVVLDSGAAEDIIAAPAEAPAAPAAPAASPASVPLCESLMSDGLRTLL